MDSTGRADSSAEAAPQLELFRDANDDRRSTSDESLTLSSVGSSFFTTKDNLSLNSSTTGSALPPNIFAGMETLTSGSHDIDESGHNTILSSNPSVTVPPPPEVSRDVFMLSPHPQIATVGVNSMSTMSTEVYPTEQVVFRDTTLGDRTKNDEAPLSMASSHSTTVNVLLGGDQRPVSGSSFEDGAFERVASHMASVPDLPKDSGTNGWHDKLVSDSDWSRFRATSEALLPFISEEDSESVSQCLLPLPPKPSGVVASSNAYHLRAVYRAEDHLPAEFICGMCKDVIVGACIVDSNRGSWTVCMSCWEERDRNQQDFAKQMDFVWVEESKKCPVYCHALDVAILRIVQDLPDSDGAVRALKQSYYHRLSVWRKKVSDRNERLRNEKMIRDDELLARLIQEEERVFWEQRNHTRPQERTKRIFGIPSNGFVVVSKAFLALLAIAGLKHISKR